MSEIDELIQSAIPQGLPGGKALETTLLGYAERGDQGANDDELARMLGPKLPGGLSTVRPRRGDILKEGLLEDTGLKRPTATGKPAKVWKLSASGRAALLPSFKAADLGLIGSTAGTAWAALSGAQQAQITAVRTALAQMARLGQRVSADAHIDCAESISPAHDAGGLVESPVAHLSWQGAISAEIVFIYVSADADGLAIGLELPSPAVGETVETSRSRERLRAHLRELDDDAQGQLGHLVAEGWEPLARESETWSAVAVDAWLGSPQAAGLRLERRFDPLAAEAASFDVGGYIQGFVAAVAPTVSSAIDAAIDPAAALAEALYWDEPRARHLLDLVGRSRQLLFAGPPGTGKTFAARALARVVAASAGYVRIIQFHPTYAYEDFVEGIRPVLIDEVDDEDDTSVALEADESNIDAQPDVGQGLAYRLRKGVLRLVAEEAVERRGHAVFLIVDEINRANLPRVLGELLFALEYRKAGDAVFLPYSGDEFTLPENLWIIGSMNTADRSVAMLDAAMRRRFKQVRFQADYDALRRWHASRTTAEQGNEAASRLERLNTVVREVLDEDREIGHSFLMVEELDYGQVWDEDIEPVLRDHLIGQLDSLEDLRSAFLAAA